MKRRSFFGVAVAGIVGLFWKGKIPCLEEAPLWRGHKPLTEERAAKTHFPYPREPQWETNTYGSNNVIVVWKGRPLRSEADRRRMWSSPFPPEPGYGHSHTL